MMASFKATAKRILEAAVVLALVLFFFLVILVTLNMVFPTGQSLFELVRPGGNYADRSGVDGRVREHRLVTEGGDSLPGEGSGVTAVLTRAEHSVKSKRADQIAWQNAAKGMSFYDRDAVQTMEGSAATISFKEGNYLELDENSLVVLRKMERDVFLRENRTVIVLMEGKLTGQTAGTRGESLNLEVVVPGAVAQVPPPDERGRSNRFQVAVKKDDTSVLTVVEGTADLVVDGSSMEVGANQIVKIQPGKPPVYLSPPPDPPLLLAPSEGAKYLFRDIPPVVAFEWESRENIDDYHFVLAMDPLFEEIVHEEVIRDKRFSHGNLRRGDYFWRVSSLSTDQEGPFTAARGFELIQDLDPPVLEVTYPELPITGDVLELKGTTEPGARVFVGTIPVKVGEGGEFAHRLVLEGGPNVVVVEAVDKAGNVAYFSRIVNVEQR